MSSAVSGTVSASTSRSTPLTSAVVAGPATPSAASTRVFGVSVSVSVSIAAASQTDATSQTQEGSQVLATLQQTQQALRDQNKKDAAAKLDEAVKELSLLKLLGTTIEGAREAVKLAKQVAAAVTEYSAAGGTPSASATAAAAGLSSTDQATSGTSNGATASTTNATANTASAQQDPFYTIAAAVLTALRKFLKKTLADLQNSSDPTIRAEARKLGRAFDKVLSSLDAASTTSGQDSTTTGSGSGATLTAAATIGVSVDLVA